MPTDSSTLPRPGTSSTTLVASSIGKKFLMALTGVMVFGFVLGHLAGNLLIFAGPEALNTYAEKLQSLGPVLWFLRGGLLIAFVAHIVLGIQLRALNSAARPIDYGKKKTIQASLASRYMWVSGLIVLVFIFYHLGHYTFKVTHPEFQFLQDSQGRLDVYTMVVLGFQQWYLVGFYLLGVGLLGWHLSHGLASMFQSLGLMHSRWRKPLDLIATLFGIVVFTGYASIPLSVVFGVLGLTEGVR